MVSKPNRVNYFLSLGGETADLHPAAFPSKEFRKMDHIQLFTVTKEIDER
jgi:hypothetical protein